MSTPYALPRSTLNSSPRAPGSSPSLGSGMSVKRLPQPSTRTSARAPIQRSAPSTRSEARLGATYRSLPIQKSKMRTGASSLRTACIHCVYWPPASVIARSGVANQRTDARGDSAPQLAPGTDSSRAPMRASTRGRTRHVSST